MTSRLKEAILAFVWSMFKASSNFCTWFYLLARLWKYWIPVERNLNHSIWNIHSLVVYWVVHEKVDIRNAHLGVLLHHWTSDDSFPPCNKRLTTWMQLPHKVLIRPTPFARGWSSGTSGVPGYKSIINCLQFWRINHSLEYLKEWLGPRQQCLVVLRVSL